MFHFAAVRKQRIDSNLLWYKQNTPYQTSIDAKYMHTKPYLAWIQSQISGCIRNASEALFENKLNFAKEKKNDFTEVYSYVNNSSFDAMHHQIRTLKKKEALFKVKSWKEKKIRKTLFHEISLELH